MRLFFKFLLIISVFLTVALFGAWYALCPILRDFPVPIGNYGVGLMSFRLIDENRDDTRQTSGKRELMIDIFFPGRCKHLCSSYQPNKLKAIQNIKAQQTDIPLYFWKCLLSGMTSYAVPDAALDSKQAKYPVVIFLPGIGAENLYQVYLEELASHGYIVVALEPAFDITVTVFSDGRQVKLDPQLRDAMKKLDRDAIYAYRTKAHLKWMEDVDFVLAQLKKMNEMTTSPFYQKLDFDNIGVMGHSQGGGVAMDYCAQRTSCKAGINMDGWTKTVNTTKGFKKPFLFLMNEKGFPEVNELTKNMPGYAQKVEIPGARHDAFSDLILMKWPFTSYLGIAAGNADEIRKEIGKYIVTFFDKHLKSSQNR